MPDIILTGPNSESFSAYLAEPKGTAKAPALILIQEIFGVNANMRAWCDHFAALGYMALCPDLFWRQEPGVQLTDQTDTEWQRAFALLQGFDIDLGVTDLSTSLAFLRAHPRCSGKVGALGFCLGGRLAVLMSCRTSIDAAVSYYGIALDGYFAEFKNIKTPLLMHVAGQDKFMTPQVIEGIQTTAATNPLVTCELYPAQNHAFARVGGEHYDEPAARLANCRTAEFLAKALKE